MVLLKCNFQLSVLHLEKTEAYRPPQARGSDYKPLQLHQYEPASNPKQPQATIMGTGEVCALTCEGTGERVMCMLLNRSVIKMVGCKH